MKETEKFNKLGRKAESEIQNYVMVANQIIGFAMLSIDGIILSHHKPFAIALMFLPLVIGLFIYMWKNYSKSLEILKRYEKKYHNDYNNLKNYENVNKLRKDLESKYLTVKHIVTDYSLYFYGTLLYGIFFIMLSIEVIFHTKMCCYEMLFG